MLVPYGCQQIQILLITNLACLIYAGLERPMLTKQLNNALLTHEFVIICLTSQMCWFTDYVTNPADRYVMGWIFILQLSLFIVACLVGMLNI